MKPIVSLIVPCYNAEPYIADFKQQIYNQTYRPLEIVLVDDGSTDNTGALLKAWEQENTEENISIKAAANDKNRGAAGAINTGLKFYTGEFVCFPDVDDRLYADYVEAMAEPLLANPQKGWAVCRIEVVKEDSPEQTWQKPQEYDSLLGEDIFKGIVAGRSMFSACTLMARRRYFEQVQNHHTLYESSATQEWQIILPLSFYQPYLLVDKVLYKYIIHPGSQSETNKKANYERAIVYGKEHTIAHNKSVDVLLADDDYKVKLKACGYIFGFFLQYDATARWNQMNALAALQRETIDYLRPLLPFNLPPTDALMPYTCALCEAALDYLVDWPATPGVGKGADLERCIKENGGYIVYGAGNYAQRYLPALINAFGPPAVIWDKNAAEGSCMLGVPVEKPEQGKPALYGTTPVLITIYHENIAMDVANALSGNGCKNLFFIDDILATLKTKALGMAGEA